jgi:hypothetical protein
LPLPQDLDEECAELKPDLEQRLDEKVPELSRKRSLDWWKGQTVLDKWPKGGQGERLSREQRISQDS